MIDCGEGTQLLIKKYDIKLSRINCILISHLHGDHYYGLIGLISTLHLYGREADLIIYGPPGLADIITLQLKYSETRLSYHIDFREWVPGVAATIYEDGKLTIETLPLDHRVPCCGYLFREKPKRRGINRTVLKETLPPNKIEMLKDGVDILDENGAVLYEAHLYTLPPKEPFSYAFCSDTRLIPSLAEKLKGVDLIYHEATFMDDMQERAKNTFHTTARQAATLARDAQVGKLILGHFSTRYRDLLPLLAEARSEFPNTDLAIEGQKFVIS